MAEEERPPNTDGTSGSATDSPLPLESLPAEGGGQGEGEQTPAHGSTSSPRAEEPTTEDRLAEAEARAETLAAELEAERDAHRQAQGERDALKEQLSLSAAKYREALLASLPEVPPELVEGGSVEEVDRSLVSARATVDAVRRQLAGRAAAERVPAGAPVRGAPDLSALSPREKIALALSRG